MQTIVLNTRKRRAIQAALDGGNKALASKLATEVVALQNFEFKPGMLYEIEGDEYVFAGGGKVKVQYDRRQLNLPGFKGKYKGKLDKVNKTPFVFFDHYGDVEKFPHEYIEDALAAGELDEKDKTSDFWRWADNDLLDEEAVRNESSLLFESYDEQEGSEKGAMGFGIPYWMETAMGTEWTEAQDYFDLESLVYMDWEVGVGTNYSGISGSGDIMLHSEGNGDSENEMQLDSDWTYGLLNGRKLQALMKRHNPEVSWSPDYIHGSVWWFAVWSVDEDELKAALSELKESDPDSFNSLYTQASSWMVSDRSYKSFDDIIDELVGAPGENVAATASAKPQRKPGITTTARYFHYQHNKPITTHRKLDKATAKRMVAAAAKGLGGKGRVSKKKLMSWFASSPWATEYAPHQFARAFRAIATKKTLTEVLKAKVANRVVAMSDEATELLLYAQNDGDLYRSMVQSVQKNLERKIKSGKYNHKFAPKAWLHVLDAAAKKYVKEFDAPGSKWSDVFPKKARMEAAQEWADQWYEEKKLEEGIE